MKAWLRDRTEPTGSERAVLERRAERVSKKRADEQEQQEAWLAQFRLGTELYAFHLEIVRAALPLRMVAPVPLAPAHVVGVVRFEGQLICVLSLLSLLGMHGWRTDPKVLLVIEPEPGRCCAVDCETVPHAAAVPKAAIEQAVLRGTDPVVVFATSGLERINLVHDFPKVLSLALAGGRRAD